MSLNAILAGALVLIPGVQDDQPLELFEALDVFELELAADPQISPDGERIVYVRRFMDIMSDRSRSNLWVVNADGSDHRPLTMGDENDSSPRWSPDAKQLLYVSSRDGKPQIYVRWMDSGQTARVTHLQSAPGGLSWSPDGKWVAFTMFVEDAQGEIASMPKKPEGAEWAAPAKVITQLTYRADGQGYLSQGNTQLFVVPALGGTPRQLTMEAFDVDGTPQWTPDGKSILFSSNRRPDFESAPLDSDVYSVSVEDGTLVYLTGRNGPDRQPLPSPSGKYVAYLSFHDTYQGYQITELYVMDADGGYPRSLTEHFDRSILSAHWASDESGLYVSYSSHGDTQIGFVSLEGGDVKFILRQVGGTSLGRPYASGSFSVSTTGRIAVTVTSGARPADIAVFDLASNHFQAVTEVNQDLLGHKTLGSVEEIRFVSSHDSLLLQGWIVKPPGFDKSKRYPLILEIHGGPFADYGERFTAECQLYAAAGYVVLYMNPRGSTSYGADFGNAIHHAYPGYDYDDLMSGVDAVLTLGYVDEDQLFVTGGSGGGVLTAWIVGKTDRFRAAVVAKPVINWTSFALTADSYNFFHKYWFPGLPWEEQEHYWARSPLSLVGNVETPTMLLCGEVDYRTPISEAEQFYQALKLCGVDSALVRIPGASHGITARPSNLIAKVAHILAWFEQHKDQKKDQKDD